ncbi:hypothetical protein Nepgr_032654 [Nepenthes gracilis]|uniref:Uncharacterized protein n=1 Tax=Nepenthes gracilis TaxID=150966 RepID=A0AAD3Y8G6_NEPGR|nr:hypothetical protein Nepgr_032654 [Nepenthes gracilis]
MQGDFPPLPSARGLSGPAQLVPLVSPKVLSGQSLDRVTAGEVGSCKTSVPGIPLTVDVTPPGGPDFPSTQILASPVPGILEGSSILSWADTITKDVEVSVVYQWKPVKCGECRKFGHSTSQCTSIIMSPSIPPLAKNSCNKELMDLPPVLRMRQQIV